MRAAGWLSLLATWCFAVAAALAVVAERWLPAATNVALAAATLALALVWHRLDRGR